MLNRTNSLDLLLAKLETMSRLGWNPTIYDVIVEYHFDFICRTSSISVITFPLPLQHIGGKKLSFIPSVRAIRSRF